jgi:carbamoyltransferase
MQFAVRCKEPKKIPAVVHKDGTSRVQVVGKNSNNKQMFEILQHWYKLTGCPVLLNTSLNIKGQPMINDLEDVKMFEQKHAIKVFYDG